MRYRELIEELLVKHTGQIKERIHKDVDRDFYMSAGEAVKYGIVDEILARNKRMTAGAKAK
jgi:ATP-dependent Clp protease protease subunit